MRKVYLLLLMALMALPASATVRYVNADRSDNAGDGLTWASAHQHLQSALAAATDGDQIWVARGIYKPTDNALDRDASFVMKEGVAIYGGFTSGQMNLNDRNSDPASNGTVLSGDIDGDGTITGNSFHVIYNMKNDLTIRAVLDGFTVRGGEDYNYSYGGAQSEGSAMYNEESSPAINRCFFLFNNSTGAGGAIFNKNSSPSILNCSFRGNASGSVGGAVYVIGGSPSIANCNFQFNVSLSFDGGAIFLSNTGSATEIKDCRFEGNVSFYNGGAIYKEGGSLRLTHCSFETNNNKFGRSVGGGAVNNRGSIWIENCNFFKNNTGGVGGALSTSGDDCQILNTTFAQNGASRGGAIFSSGNTQLRNCLFQNNGAFTAGGAVYNLGSPTIYGENFPKFTNCTFLGNSANEPVNSNENGGGAIYNFGKGSPQLINCALWNNGGANTFHDGGANSIAPILAYTLVDASAVRYSGIGPNTVIQVTQSPFISDSDARLRPGSPAIDAGLNSANATATDLAGNQRIINGTIDMGAYEFGSTAGDFAIVGVNGVNCQTLSPTARQLTFTPSYQGSDGSPVTFGVYNEMLRTQAPGPYSLRLYTDNPTITLTAKQGDKEEIRYRYDWLADCPALPKALAITGVGEVDCQVLSPTARKVIFTPVYEGGDGSPVTFSVYGEMVGTQAPGPYSLRLYIDNPSINLMAQQGSVHTRFRFDWLSVCNNAAARLGVTEEPGSELQLTLLGNPVSDGVVKLEVRGAQGQPLIMQLIDTKGQLIAEEQVKQAKAIEGHSFEVGQQAAGILLLRVSKSDQSKTIKVLNLR